MSGAWSGGKGDSPRPIKNKKQYDETMTRICGDHCRFNHEHTEECKLKESDKNGSIGRRTKKRG